MRVSTLSSLRLPNLNKLVLLIAVLVGAGLYGLLLALTEHRYYAALEQTGNERLDLYASTVESAHKRFDYLPYIVAGDYQVQGLLRAVGVNGDPSADPNADLGAAVNRKLETWQSESNAADLYLMDHQGRVIASSNWQRDDSFIGNDYHFRPYFVDAIEGRQGKFFAVGVTTGRPGLFLSRPVIINNQVRGVAVVKIDMTRLETDWAAGGESVWITDPDGVVFLASDAAWKYQSLERLSDTTAARLKAAKKYSNNPVTPLPLSGDQRSPQGNRIIQLTRAAQPGQPATRQHYLMHSRSITGLDWMLFYLSDLQGLDQDRQQVALIAVLVGALTALLGLFGVSRIKGRQLLEQRVASRTEELNQSNQRLQREINERSKAEEELRQSHQDLIQAEKLAALGQLSAGLVHEISQPLSAMQTFIASTRLLIERQQTSSALENLADIDSMVRRVTKIVFHLKTFASKSRGHAVRVELGAVVDNALLVMSSRLAQSDVVLDWTRPAHPLIVKADEIKLEQIIVNLTRNALDAMDDDSIVKPGRLAIKLVTATSATGTDQVSLSIEDSGGGINQDDLPRVFDPFFTTKPPGQGLGLGLSVSYEIAREFGGQLEVANRAEGGTIFTLSLDTAKEAIDEP